MMFAVSAPVLGFFGVVATAVIGLMGAGVNAALERRNNQPYKTRAQEIEGMAESVKALLPTVAALRVELDIANAALIACLKRDLDKAAQLRRHDIEIAELRRQINGR